MMVFPGIAALLFIATRTALFASAQQQSQTQTPTTIQNAAYLGRGYNILRGNPRPTDASFDPGFANAIFELGSISNYQQPTTDVRYLFPRNTEFFDCQSCQSAASTDIITGEESYRNSLMQQVTVDGSTKYPKLAKASFEASYSTKTVYEETIKKRRIVVESKKMCVVFCGRLKQFNGGGGGDVTYNFQSAVSLLTDLSGNDTMVASLLVSTFGTHVVTGVQLGAMLWQRATINETDWKRLMATAETTTSIKVKASGFLETTPQYAASPWTGRSLTDQSMFQDRATYTLGPQQRSGNSWYDEVLKNPLPIKLTLMPLTQLLTATNFPREYQIEAKRKFMEYYIENTYCSELKDQGEIDDCSLFGSRKNDNGVLNLPTLGGSYCFRCDQYNLGLYVYKNTLSGDFTCPIGFDAVVLGASSIASLVMCFNNRNSAADDDGSFGGMYAGFTCNGERSCNGALAGQRFYPNVVTGNFSCPTGYDAVSVSSGRINNCCNGGAVDFDVWACSRRVFNGYIGGFFSTFQNGTGRSKNPATAATTCQQPYRAVQILKGWEGISRDNDSISGYACML